MSIAQGYPNASALKRLTWIYEPSLFSQVCSVPAAWPPVATGTTILAVKTTRRWMRLWVQRIACRELNAAIQQRWSCGSLIWWQGRASQRASRCRKRCRWESTQSKQFDSSVRKHWGTCRTGRKWVVAQTTRNVILPTTSKDWSAEGC